MCAGNTPEGQEGVGFSGTMVPLYVAVCSCSARSSNMSICSCAAISSCMTFLGGMEYSGTMADLLKIGAYVIEVKLVFMIMILPSSNSLTHPVSI